MTLRFAPLLIPANGFTNQSNAYILVIEQDQFSNNSSPLAAGRYGLVVENSAGNIVGFQGFIVSNTGTPANQQATVGVDEFKMVVAPGQIIKIFQADSGVALWVQAFYADSLDDLRGLL